MKRIAVSGMIIVTFCASVAFGADRWRASYSMPLRPNPSPYGEIGTIKQGQIVKELGRHKWWIKVKAMGKTGWVSKYGLSKVERFREHNLVIGNLISKPITSGRGFDNLVYIRNDGDIHFSGTICIEAYHGHQCVFKERYYEADILTGGGTKVRFKSNKEVHRAVLSIVRQK